jgi:hypothetical protein
MNIYLTARSKLQLQTVASYPLDSDKDTMNHALEAFLFVPKSLAVNVHTYPKYLFYRDLQTWSELLPTLRPLSHMVASEHGLLPHLEDCISKSVRNGDEQALKEFETHNRAFCRVFKNSVDAHLEYIRRKGDSSVGQHGIEQFLRIVGQALTDFRALGESLVKPCPREDFTTTFQLSDEYLSLLVEESACKLLERQQAWKEYRDPELEDQLHQLAVGELNHRRDQGYRSVPAAKGHNERLVYRRSALRTYIESVFFLSTRHKPEGRLARELMLSMAAGMAMVFATAAAFVAHVQYENWTTTFFVILVISYMFKDRIKALTQDYLKTKGQRLFFDFRTTIFGQTTQRPLGVQRESFSFAKSGRVDPAVLRQRDRDKLDALDNDYCGEHIIHYKRRTTLYTQRVTAAFEECGIDGVNEIIHFDLTRFARKMENAKSTVYIPGEDGYKKESGRMVYHLHLVIKYQSASQDAAAPIYRHYRIVMTRNGIQRIDDMTEET